jgi:hypothetical protein
MEDVSRLYTNAMPFYVKVLSVLYLGIQVGSWHQFPTNAEILKYCVFFFLLKFRFIWATLLLSQASSSLPWSTLSRDFFQAFYCGSSYPIQFLLFPSWLSCKHLNVSAPGYRLDDPGTLRVDLFQGWPCDLFPATAWCPPSSVTITTVQPGSQAISKSWQFYVSRSPSY